MKGLTLQSIGFAIAIGADVKSFLYLRVNFLFTNKLFLSVYMIEIEG
jgi:hypothetical protein